jgi:branched-chain amino acid transport system permease protein
MYYRPCGVFDETYSKDLAVVRTRLGWAFIAGSLAFLFLLPMFFSSAIIANINSIGIVIVSVLGLQIVTGYTGQISLGQAAFMAVGGYTSFILSVHLGFPFLIVLPASGLSAGAVGIVFGIPSLRLKGFYLAMSTLAAQFIIPWLIVNAAPDITGGTSTMVLPPPSIGNWVFDSQQSMFFIIMILLSLSIFFSVNLFRSRVGRAFIAIRDNDLAAKVMGVDVFKYKLMAFFMSAFYAGIAGSLWVYWMRCVAVDHFTLANSIWFLGMLVVGGMGNILGAVLGAVSIRLLDLAVLAVGPQMGNVFPSIAAVATASLAPTVFGLTMMLFLIFEPRGLSHLWEKIRSIYRMWPFSY